MTFQFEILAAAPFQKVLTFSKGQRAHLRYFVKKRYMIQKFYIIQLHSPEIKILGKKSSFNSLTILQISLMFSSIYNTYMQRPVCSGVSCPILYYFYNENKGRRSLNGFDCQGILGTEVSTRC